MIRKRLPAYGAALRDRVRSGDLPLCVHLIFGYRWREPVACTGLASLLPSAHPLLAMKPSDYSPGLFDFSLVTGLHVCVFDQEGAARERVDLDHGPARPMHTRFWYLLGELAECAADVSVYSPGLKFMGGAVTADVLAFDQRRSFRWPFWWSDSIEEKNAKRRANWIAAFGHVTHGPREQLAA